MALVRKGARRISVDDVSYRWRLRGKPTYVQGLVWMPLTYAVEHAETPGTTLVVTTDQPHPSNWLGVPGRPVLPRDVATSIRTALIRGWTPDRPGSPFHLDRSEGFITPPLPDPRGAEGSQPA